MAPRHKHETLGDESARHAARPMKKTSRTARRRACDPSVGHSPPLAATKCEARRQPCDPRYTSMRTVTGISPGSASSGTPSQGGWQQPGRRNRRRRPARQVACQPRGATSRYDGFPGWETGTDGRKRWLPEYVLRVFVAMIQATTPHETRSPSIREPKCLDSASERLPAERKAHGHV